MIGPETFTALVWAVFGIGWVGVTVITVAVVREVLAIVAARRSRIKTAAPNRRTHEDGR